MPDMTARAGTLGVALAAACLLLQGCAVGPGGYSSVPQEFGGWRQVAAAPPPRGTGPYDGQYAGTATREVNGDFDCPDSTEITGFSVTNNIARLGGYVGTVLPNGHVEMLYDNIALRGQFNGPNFTGQINESGDAGGVWSGGSSQSFCIYAVSLQRTAG